MGTYRQRFLHHLTTPLALLRGEARIDSYHTMPSTCSLGTEDIEKRAPTGVHDALCQGMILHHVEYLKLLNRNHLILLSILLCNLIMEVPSLPFDLQVCLCCTASGEASAVTALLAACHGALFAPECSLRSTIETRIFDRVHFAI